MEKNLIERLVAQDAMSFLTDEYIEKIATIACDRNKQEIESDSPIPVIRDRIRQVDVSLNNLLKAIETGSAPDMLVKRMGELETEKKDMEVQLKKEMAHQVYIDKEQVIFWLEKFREGDINDEEFCQTVIDLFVNSVTVWDEPDDKFKITIAYNLTSIPQKTYRLSKDGRLSDYASNTPGLRTHRAAVTAVHDQHIFPFDTCKTVIEILRRHNILTASSHFQTESILLSVPGIIKIIDIIRIRICKCSLNRLL